MIAFLLVARQIARRIHLHHLTCSGGWLSLSTFVAYCDQIRFPVFSHLRIQYFPKIFLLLVSKSRLLSASSIIPLPHLLPIQNSHLSCPCFRSLSWVSANQIRTTIWCQISINRVLVQSSILRFSIGVNSTARHDRSVSCFHILGFVFGFGSPTKHQFFDFLSCHWFERSRKFLHLL